MGFFNGHQCFFFLCISVLYAMRNKLYIYLEELSFLTVFALPQASRTGLVWTILSSREASPSFLFPKEQMVAKKEMTFLVFSVIRMDWLLPVFVMPW